MKFIDLFCGIGGFRLAAKSLGGKCVFSSEIEKNARASYYHTFGEWPSGDITQIDAKDIPDHDILFAGFPCQPFSELGRKKGLQDERGTLFYQIIRIVTEKKPKRLLLENVMGFKKYYPILKELLEGCGYTLGVTIVNTKDMGLCQSRTRLYIEGIRDGYPSLLSFSPSFTPAPVLSDILAKDTVTPFVLKNPWYVRHPSHWMPIQGGKVFAGVDYYGHIQKKYKHIPKEQLGKNHLSHGYFIHGETGILSALTKSHPAHCVALRDGRVVWIRSSDALRCQGFPEDFTFPEGFRPFMSIGLVGNSVSPVVVKAVLQHMMAHEEGWA